MKFMGLVVVAWLLTACASNQSTMPLANDLFQDRLFAATSTPVHAEQALAVSERMRSYAQTKLRPEVGSINLKDRRRALVDAMYSKGELRLDYDATQTRTASEAFDAKSGNCLSLVLLTAAMAKELRLSVRYQSVVGMTDWSQADQLFVSIGHVNLLLDNIPDDRGVRTWAASPLIVDFLPPDQAKVLNTIVIEENTVLAMYANNRAVESLIKGKTDDAYWWTREALMQDRNFLNSYITLGVIYRKVHHPELSERVLARVSEHDPDNTTMLTNRILTLRDLGKEAEANQLAIRLAKLDPHPPLSYYHQAQLEMNVGHIERARYLYEKEIARDPGHHEFEFGLALVYFKLHDLKQAAFHLKSAMELSNSKQTRALYAAKLEWLKTRGIQ